MIIKKWEQFNESNSLNTINIDKLISIKDKLPKKDIDFWDLEHLIEHFNMSIYNININDFDPSLFEVRELYNNMHDSDTVI